MMSSMSLDSYFEDQERNGDDLETTQTIQAAMASVCQATLGRAVSASVGGDDRFTMVELHIHYMRPLPRGAGPLRCVVEGVRVGTRTATAITRVLGPSGEVYAHASMTCLLVHAPPIDPEGREGSHS